MSDLQRKYREACDIFTVWDSGTLTPGTTRDHEKYLIMYGPLTTGKIVPATPELWAEFDEHQAKLREKREQEIAARTTP